ncbi:hypothetical protein COLO4_02586 [Corchorus olitorius]|uniref:Uncharacterized protein n=1 Tax=Corchorus olitorius TaxID=93759 RepID=A0A1R3L0N7_9ROSI|nr:hypothetical protein COLO4_02586 [Corchorus olitorius]
MAARWQRAAAFALSALAENILTAMRIFTA